MKFRPEPTACSASALGAGLLSLLFIWGCATAGHRVLPPLSKGPYLQAPGPDTMSIMWESLTNVPGQVRFGRGEPLTGVTGPITPREMVGVSPYKRTNHVATVTNGVTTIKTNVANLSRTNLFYVYRATLTNLSPGTVYTYAVEMNGARTRPRSFKTLSPVAPSIRFVAYGDSRSNPRVHRAVARRFGRRNPEFVVHTGDLVMAGKDYQLWSKEFFEPVAGIADQVPIMSVPGNHEDDLKNYRAYFPAFTTNIWYSFDAGPVHFLALDFYSQRTTDRQYKFARQDLLESKALWKVVMVHNPVFNFGHHNSGWGHEAYLPLFQEAKVDLVLSGHSHMYERFRPIAPTNRPGAWAITYVTTAGGGAELHEPHPHPAHAFAVSTNHFTLIDATAQSLRGRAIRPDGVQIDSFELRKTNGHQPPDTLSRVYPEELLKAAYAVAPDLLARLASLPTNRQPALAMFTFPPARTNASPVELVIDLAPESARNYAVKELPLRLTTPASGESNKVVWVTVSTLGKKKVKGTELDPPLVFRARVKGPFGETVAYGPLSRTSQTATSAAKKRTAAPSASQ